MRVLVKCCAWILLIPILTRPVRAVAQEPRDFRITVAGMVHDLDGDEFGGIDPTIGVEAQIAYLGNLPRGVSLAVGYHWSEQGSINGTNIRVQGMFFEPRLTFNPKTGRVAPFIAGRLSILKLSVPADRNGTGFGGAVGMQVTASSRVHVETSGGLSLVSFPETNTTVHASGVAWMFRLGAGVTL